MKKRFWAAAVLIAVIFAFSLSACDIFAPVQTAGKSAYEIACDNGFEGTVQEWLDSLKGKDGKNGIDGTQGQGGIYDTVYATEIGIKSAVSVRSVFSGGAGSGSGVVYKITGNDVYIITNYHVVYDKAVSDNIKVFTYGKENAAGVPADFIDGSAENDIAVLKALRSDFSSEIIPAQTADSDEIKLGERVVAIGNPLGLGISVSSGVVSVLSEEILMRDLNGAGDVTISVIRTDTPINKGNSGGGLFDMRGKLVGIINAKAMSEFTVSGSRINNLTITSNGVENIGFAIPINTAKSIADGVIAVI